MTRSWTTQEWLHFLKFVQEHARTHSGDRVTIRPPGQPGAWHGELDSAFNLTRSGNSEIAFQWLLMSIRNRYEPA